MKLLAAFLTLGWLAASVVAQELPRADGTTTSASGQFLVVAPPAYGGSLATVSRFADTNLVRLNPTLLAVSAERVKILLWRELKLTGGWQGKIFLRLQPARTGQERPVVQTVAALEGWAVRAELPDHLTRHQLVRALVETLLLEFANRTGTQRAAEIPAWLADGFAFHLIANHGEELVLEAPAAPTGGMILNSVSSDRRRFTELERAHKILVGDEPLTFEQLSWPNDAQLAGPARLHYLASAQLFTLRLLRLPDGPACFRDFLATLPAFANWQFALLRGFHPHFGRLLDVEKWWTLEAAHFAGRDLTQTWSVQESWAKLAAALREPVNRYSTPDALPERAEISLQEVLRDWKPSQQAECLRQKLRDLALLRLRLAPDYAGLADDYRRALENGLRRREAAAPANGPRWAPPVETTLAATIRELDVLDARLTRMRP